MLPALTASSGLSEASFIAFGPRIHSVTQHKSRSSVYATSKKLLRRAVEKVAHALQPPLATCPLATPAHQPPHCPSPHVLTSPRLHPHPYYYPAPDVRGRELLREVRHGRRDVPHVHRLPAPNRGYVCVRLTIWAQVFLAQSLRSFLMASLRMVVRL